VAAWERQSKARGAQLQSKGRGHGLQIKARGRNWRSKGRGRGLTEQQTALVLWVLGAAFWVLPQW